MKQRQRGMTFLGVVIILVILGAGFYAALRLVPVYLEFSKVARVLEQVRDEHSAIDSTSSHLIRNSLERRWDVEDIKSLGWKEVEITQKSDGFEVVAAYDVEQPFVANVYLLTKFDKTVVIPR
jgi:type II secretory pathway pseudopilin PulG